MKPKMMNIAAKLLALSLISACMVSCQLKSEVENGFMRTQLNSQAPEPLVLLMETIKSQMNLSDIKYSSLNTGIDTVDIYFGSFMQLDRPGYWISIAINGSPLSWTTVSLLDSDTLEFPSNNIDLNFDNGSKRVSLRLNHNPETDEIFYSWLHKGEISKNAQILVIETPIGVNRPFPDLEVNLLNGEPIRINDFLGKYIVINWWHSACGPCIAAMPGLNKLIATYENHPDIKFIAIAADSKERVEGFLKRREFNFLQTLGNNESAEIFGESFPKYVIINPDGIVTYYASGGSENSHVDIDNSLSQQIIN